MSVIVAILIVLFGLIIVGQASSSKATSTAGPNLISMEASADAMTKAGETMKAHGQEMLDQAGRTNNAELLGHGEHWIKDGQALTQAGGSMAQDPTASQNLQASRSDLQAQGSWRDLTQRAQTMLHDPTQASSLNLDALDANGTSMLAEGQNMAEHGRIMAEEVVAMIAGYNLQGPAATDLRGAAEVMQAAGGTLAKNGQEMVDYADRLRRSLGLGN